ncbi:MAG TPA: hypothetical protein VKA30_10050 [Actinomycetota bacterium]|nr:hypothetical protein [Actinomycetota bacterium]
MTTSIGTGDGLLEIDDSSGRIARVELPVSSLSRSRGSLAVLSKDRVLVRASGRDELDEIGTIPDGLTGRCIVDSSSGLLVGTSNARLLRADGQELQPVGGFDAAEGRDGWYTPWGGPPDTRSLSEGPEGTLFANVHVGGILRSRDGGQTWEPTIDVDADVHQVLAHPRDPAVVLAATAYGLALSEDSGDSWRFDTEGLHADYCRAVALGGDHVFVSASRSHRGDQAAVYRRPLEGGPFERCRGGLPEWFGDNVDSHCLAANGETVVIGGPDGAAFVSSDGGSTWHLVAKDLGHITAVGLT